MCERCDFVAAEKASVLAHLASHLTDTATGAAVDSSGGMHYSCTQCGFVTTSMEALVLHISNNCTHTSQDPSQGEIQQEKLASKIMCSECGYVADSTELMRSHMWMHLDKGSGSDVSNECCICHYLFIYSVASVLSNVLIYFLIYLVEMCSQ